MKIVAENTRIHSTNRPDGGEILPFIQQCPIILIILKEMLYFVQDFVQNLYGGHFLPSPPVWNN
ncbi:hypothetical protein QW71_21285 [Paenibacillus sp. IHB B 3415]|nr:hypothetical protein QW71_21285 [Paenibacillus sp. IHB B 3415]